MRKHVGWLLLGSLALFVAGPGLAAEKKTDCPKVEKYGAGVKVKKPVELAELVKAPGRFAGEKIRIEGTVKAVCQGKGCWVEVEAEDGASFIARSLDEKVLLPTDCKGRKIVVQGVVKALPKPKQEKPKAAEKEPEAEEEPQAEEKAHAEDEAYPEGHACPRPEWVLAIQGVELR